MKLTVHTEPMSAELVRGILLEAGLHPLPLREVGHATLPGIGSDIFVFVPREELQAAVKVIRDSSYARFLW